MKLLHVDSSILGGNSVSRELSGAIVAREAALHPELEVTYRDLAATAPGHLSGMHIAAWQGATPEDAALAADVALGTELLNEVLAADIIVIGAPMYNFSVPSQLKAWIDRLLVAGKTFRYTANGAEGLVTDKKAFIAISRGGIYGPETPTAAFEHQESYLRATLSFIGITDVTVIRAEGIAIGPEARESAVTGAQQEIAALAA